MKRNLLSVVIPAKNEASHIRDCIGAFDAFSADGRCEVLVVDNFSDDGTAEIAKTCGATVFSAGPERSAQRNFGWRHANGDYVMFIDADMIVPDTTTAEILERINSPSPPDALYIREVRTGRGIRTAARNFERSFYDATCIDALRVVSRPLLEQIGGYDENLLGPEDWDLDRKALQITQNVALTDGHLWHNEKFLTLKRTLQKKRYYCDGCERYREKWHNDEIVRRQLGIKYRYWGVFTENGKWRKLLRHPLLAAVMFFERFCIGVVYLANRK